MRRPAGRDLCFTFSVTDEHRLIRDRVRRIGRIYPDSRVVLVPDVPAGVLPRRPARPDVVVLTDRENQYAVVNGGRVVQTHLEAFLDSKARWWFKVDPDTVLRRRFRELPDEPCFFGTIQGGGPGPSLQGGCIGGTRSAAQLLVESGVLLSPELQVPERTWARGNPNLLDRARRGLVSFDFVHAWACRELGIPLVEHSEIRSEWRRPPADPDRYAVTHPHKTLDERAERQQEARRCQVAGRLVELIRVSVPVGATVAVVSKGDESLAGPGRSGMRHFPADEKGGWAGYHPSDSAHAIRLLEDERARGADHIALPETSAWWLDYYDGLADHLSTRHQLVAHEDGAGRVWALRGDSS